MASTVNGSISEGELGGHLMESDPLSRDIFPKYKRRKVSGIRDFPPGCGRFAPQINLTQKTDVANGDGVTNFVGLDDTGDTLRNDSTSQSPRVAHSSGLIDTQEKPMVMLDRVDGIEPTVAEPVSQLPGALEGSSDIILNGPSKVLELETSELLKSPHQVNISASEQNPVSDSCALEGSNDTGLSVPLKVSELETTNLVEDPHEVHIPSFEEELIYVPKGNDLEKDLTKDYPPPRKVFAVRDFPPFCGRNAPCLEEAEKSIKPPPESNQYRRDEAAVEKGKDLKKNTAKEIMVYQKKILKRKVPDKPGPSEHLREDSEGLEGAPRMIDKTEKNIKPSRESNQHFRDETALKKNTEKEIVMYKKKILKRKVPDGSSEQLREDREGLEGSSRRMVVFGLRATPNSPNRTGVGRRMNDKSKSSVVKSAKMKENEWYDTEATRKQEDNMDVEGSPRYAGKEMVIDTEKRSPEEKLFEYCDDLEVVSDRVVVHALLARGNNVGRQRKVSANKGKKLAVTYFNDSEHTVRMKPKKMTSPTIGNDAHDSTSRQLMVLNQDLSEDDDEEIDDFHVSVRSCKFDLCLPPFGKGDEHGGCVTRNKVRETLRLFQVVSRKLLQEEETKSKEQGVARKRIDLAAAKILKLKGKYVNTGPHILGPVPGVEVGDEFHYRVELNIIGLHRQIQGGIDYMKRDGQVIATSIVASGGYADELDSSDFLIYTGQGGNMMGGDKEPEDQKLERGNLALKTSILVKNPVRVIRGFKDTKSDSNDARGGRPVVVMTYIYDGLYLVEKSWQEEGSHGKLVFKFRLARVPGQPELAWKQVKKSDTCRIREGLCDNDISQGKEIIPICAVNTIDDEKPPQFQYITHMIYPDWCRPIPPKGCDCSRKCSECKKCSCAILNGGEIPFNYNGAIVEAKPLVYECGPLCKCPPSCPNRVSQHGIRFQLEIFKTESRGWGVRSLNSISSGSFICEYAGELLEEKEADARTGNDEYLFDIGNNYNDTTLWGGLSTLMPDATSNSSRIVEDGFTIDAAQYGNIGRFINHSCSPNLYAQNVLYDHEDKRVPHIMFFAAENIPPLQELTYHYNYMIDQVRDSNGNIKKKSCYCGAADCTGRMY